MADRIKIHVATDDGKGSVYCTDYEGNEYVFKGEAYQELACAVTSYGTINPAKWDRIYDPKEEAEIAKGEIDEVTAWEWDEEAAYCTDNGI